MNQYKEKVVLSLLVLLFAVFNVYAGTTGKLAGVITDKSTGESIPGANIIIEGTRFGAAANNDGYYYINNITPGVYNIYISAVGYSKTKISNVAVRIDLSTKLDVKLSESAITGKEVVVVAEREMIQKDLTSSSSIVSSDDIQMMPVDNISQIINLQAGVVGGHFRGGRSSEVAYLVDGMSVNDAATGGMSLEVENSAIREMEIISGTFNAEYGQAMSGIVNMVMKEGGQKLEGTASVIVGSYLTSHSDIFWNMDKIQTDGTKDFQFSLSGPLPLLKDLTFFTNGRYNSDDGYLYGKRVFNVSDNTPTVVDAANNIWFANNTGDGAYVAMSPTERKSFNSKLTYSISDWKFSYGLFWNDIWSKHYSHAYALTPDGIPNNYRSNLVHNIQITFAPSQSVFTTLKFSSNGNKYYGYLYSDPYDSRYVKPSQGQPSTSYTFRQGGNSTSRYASNTTTYLAQWALNAQLNKEHKISIGAEGRMHDLYNSYKEFYAYDDEAAVFKLTYPDYGTPGNTSYQRYPYEASAYFQDKMEYDIMIINAGVRFDYFNSNTNIPVDLRNPLNNTLFNGANQKEKSESEYQISPRLGISFPISDKGAIHFSYGHFFQIPNFDYLYTNPDYYISQDNSLSSYTGNPNLKSQKTVKYEIGIQQMLFPDIVMDVNVYYSDIRNLLGMEILNTYEGFKYARYINKDYGNVKGFTLSLEKKFSDYYGVKMDYTYQVAEGNSSDPMSVYNDNQTNPPVETEKSVVALDWDQRSTLNITANAGAPGEWNLGLIFQMGSGMPYTRDATYTNFLRTENDGRLPAGYNLDIRFDKWFNIFGIKLGSYIVIYNVLDIKNETGVYASTGRATFDLATQNAGNVVGLNTIEEYLKNPGLYSSPRQIKIGVNVSF